MIKKILFLGPVFLVAICAAVILRFNPWYVKNELVKLNQVDCVSAEQIRAEESLVNKNMLTIDERAIQDKILNQHVCVKEVLVKREFPTKVEIDLQGREGVLALTPRELDASVSAQITNFLSDITPAEATPSSESALLEDLIKDPNLSPGGGSYLIDKAGVIFEKLGGSSPIQKVLTYGYEVRVGKKLDAQLVGNMLAVFDKLHDLSLPVNLAIVKSDGLAIKSSDLSLFFALDSDIDRQIASLQLILQAGKMNSDDYSASKEGSKKVSSVDLRFSKPVVVYSQK